MPTKEAMTPKVHLERNWGSHGQPECARPSSKPHHVTDERQLVTCGVCKQTVRWREGK